MSSENSSTTSGMVLDPKNAQVPEQTQKEIDAAHVEAARQQGIREDAARTA